MECGPGKAETVCWFGSGDEVVAVPEAMHADFGPAQRGRRCQVKDYELTAEIFGELSDRKSRPGSLLGTGFGDFLRPDGTKIGGHVNWIQSPEEHVCHCGTRMTYVAQVASRWNFMIADCGRLYIFVCPRPGCRRSLATLQSF
jgi:hypothetical protein